MAKQSGVTILTTVGHVAQFFFTVPAHNAWVDRLFSLIHVHSTNERNRLSVDSVKSILLVKLHFTYRQLYGDLMQKKDILKKIRSSEKYTWNTI
uniref:Uncharacterized protein n=1 Tax=Arion vulgaris TaxID=1028688 RepID=A0A0B7AKA0_9EUPU